MQASRQELWEFISGLHPLQTCVGCHHANAHMHPTGKGVQSGDVCDKEGFQHRQQHSTQPKQVSKVAFTASLEQRKCSSLGAKFCSYCLSFKAIGFVGLFNTSTYWILHYRIFDDSGTADFSQVCFWHCCVASKIDCQQPGRGLLHLTPKY